MKLVSLPLTTGGFVSLFIGTGHLAVSDSKKEPGTCHVVDGLHNNGGWHVKLTSSAVVKMIKDAKEL